MANMIEHAAIFQTELDKAAVEQAATGFMELNENLVKYTGGDEVKIPEIDTDGLGDYDRQKGFVDGSVTLKYRTYQMTQDRGRLFTFDENEVDETNFIMTASTVMGEFQRTKVIPEVDAYRCSKIAAGAITEGRAIGGYTPAEATILQKLNEDVTAIQDEVGDTPLVILMATSVAGILDTSDKLARHFAVTDFQKGDVALKVKSLNGEHPIIRVGSSRMKTAFQFLDGETAGQEAGGFKPATSAKDVNWIILPKTGAIAVSKTDKVRIFDPETYQKLRSWACDYRKFHEVWVPKNKWKTIRVNIKQALS